MTECSWLKQIQTNFKLDIQSNRKNIHLTKYVFNHRYIIKKQMIKRSLT